MKSVGQGSRDYGYGHDRSVGDVGTGKSGHEVGYGHRTAQYESINYDTISKPKIRKNKYKNLFSCRGINCRNALPNDIVNASSLNIFKSKLNKIELDRYLYGRV